MDNSATGFIEDTTALRREIDRLKTDLVRLRSDFAVLSDDTMIAAKVGSVEARELLSQKAKAAVAKGRESIEKVEHQITDHPFIAVGAALAAGAIIGLLISRTRKE